MNDAYDSLTDTIYGVIFGEATWDGFLGRINEIIPGGRTSIFHHDGTRAEGASQVDKGFSDAWVDNYSKHFSKINPWIPAIGRQPLSQGFLAEDLMPRADFMKTEFYHDFWRECGNTGLGMTVFKRDGSILAITSAIARGEPEENRQFADLFTRLAPHLRRAIHYFEAGQGPKTASELGGRLFDTIGTGVVLVGDGGKLLSASEVGGKLLAEGTCLRLGINGRIQVCDTTAQNRLYAMLDRWQDDPRQHVTFVNGRKLTFIKLQKNRRMNFFDTPTLAILAEAPAIAARANVPHLSDRFGLTAAETKILRSLMDGRSVTEIAVAAGRSRETVRSQIKSIYAKTGVGSQVELLRLTYFLDPSATG